MPPPVDMSTQTAPRKGLVIVAGGLAVVVGIALLLTSLLRPSRIQSDVGLVSLGLQPQPSFVITQFVAGGPLVVGTQALDGSLIVVTQFPAPRYTIHLPSVRVRSWSSQESDLGLYDFRYQPDIKVEDLK